MPVEREAPVLIEDYNPSWPALFEQEQALLAEALAAWTTGPIEHVGSTAVPGLVAKPVIDIMVAVESLDASRPAIRVLERLHYMHFPYRQDVMHWFCKPSPAVRTHHLHLVPFGSRLWTERLAFRDFLREHAGVAAEYAALKRRLANTHRRDREAYTDAKGPFITKVLEASGSHRNHL